MWVSTLPRVIIFGGQCVPRCVHFFPHFNYFYFSRYILGRRKRVFLRWREMFQEHAGLFTALGRQSRGEKIRAVSFGCSKALLEYRENTEGIWDMPDNVKTASSLLFHSVFWNRKENRWNSFFIIFHIPKGNSLQL